MLVCLSGIDVFSSAYCFLLLALWGGVRSGAGTAAADDSVMSKAGQFSTVGTVFSEGWQAARRARHSVLRSSFDVVRRQGCCPCREQAAGEPGSGPADRAVAQDF
ncbi:hypothetical protein [Streptomyces sp. NPDC048560]|uniref:hypothetical protein n=1 Tax=Streptomyces sp. NPDC048560 TaxID=3155488 RepID=UPI00344A4E39